jgi:type IV secretory pathway VirB2 component (pilin)
LKTLTTTLPTAPKRSSTRQSTLSLFLLAAVLAFADVALAQPAPTGGGIISGFTKLLCPVFKDLSGPVLGAVLTIVIMVFGYQLIFAEDRDTMSKVMRIMMGVSIVLSAATIAGLFITSGATCV